MDKELSSGDGSEGAEPSAAEIRAREQAAYPAPWLRDFKFWPAVGRIDNVYGDRNLVCSCLPMEAYATE